MIEANLAMTFYGGGEQGLPCRCLYAITCAHGWMLNRLLTVWKF